MVKSLATILTEKHQIACFLDHFDPETRPTDFISTLLLRKVAECSHLLAFVTDQTAASWWLPFEIGVACQSKRRICTFSAGKAPLPSFLSAWPVMKTGQHIDDFAEAYHKDKTGRPIVEKYKPDAKLYTHSDEFHDALKAAILKAP